MVELTVLRFQGMIPPFHGSGGNVMVGDRNMYVRGKKKHHQTAKLTI